ncbi:PREDICTED: beta-defensin 1 [Chrysochloris asiatica]|uniref:Beta-defensin 1 n=1 Tax=Chrysochloris asiatica TaxID=185453 RepID=A0A9B0WRE6_CHRAS|nr:PREDICTED: beta-defensin 1 [Chrysochloris asiatica]
MVHKVVEVDTSDESILSEEKVKQSKYFLFLLTGAGQRSDQYKCVSKGGTCNFSHCPLFSRIEGTCYSGRAKCCIYS